MSRIFRWAISVDEPDDGSVYACSKDCARAAAENYAATLGSFQGKDGVDESNTCDGGCDPDTTHTS